MMKLSSYLVSSLVVALLATTNNGVASAATQLRGASSSSNNNKSSPSTVTEYRVTLLQHLTHDESAMPAKQVVTNRIVDGVDVHETLDIDLPEDFLKENQDLLWSGNLFIEATGSHIEQGTVVFEDDAKLAVLEESRHPTLHAEQQERKLGYEKTFAVVRVTMAASGETCRYSAAEIAYELFGRSNGGLHLLQTFSSFIQTITLLEMMILGILILMYAVEHL